MGGTLRRGLVAVLLALCTGAAWALDINEANQAQLESLKGIGPAMSTRILAQRDQGPFKDWADLLARVGGIGPAVAKRLSAAGLTVNGQPYRPNQS